MKNFKGYDCLKKVFELNPEFKKLILENVELGKIRYFSDEEWDKIKEQNYGSPHPEVKSFYDIFRLGGNEGNCTGCSKQLSYSYNNVSIAGGLLPILIGTRNSPNGEHTWLENDKEIIDTSLLLIIDKSLKEKIGYKMENIYSSTILNSDPRYSARKQFVNDRNLRSNKVKI